MEVDALCIEFRLLLQINTIIVLARYQDTDTGEYLDHKINRSDETLLTELIEELKGGFYPLCQSNCEIQLFFFQFRNKTKKHNNKTTNVL